MVKPFMGYNNLGMATELALDPTRFPIPENHVSLCVSARDPLSVGRETDLASISGNGMTSEPLLPVLPEVVCIIE
jgi:hypothetical protein